MTHSFPTRRSSDLCLDAGHIGGRRQLRCQELLETLKILGNDLQNKIDFAVQHMAFAHFGKLCHMVFEGLQVSLRLTLQTDHGKNSNAVARSEEHTSELQSLMRISYAVFCLK